MFNVYFFVTDFKVQANQQDDIELLMIAFEAIKFSTFN